MHHPVRVQVLQAADDVPRVAPHRLLRQLLPAAGRQLLRLQCAALHVAHDEQQAVGGGVVNHLHQL